MLFVVGIGLVFFLDALLLTKKNKSGADYLLAVWLLFIGLHLLFFYLFSASATEIYPNLVGLSMPFPLLHGPFLYLYVLALTHPEAKIKHTGLLHFTPVVLMYIYLIAYFLLPSDQKLVVVKTGNGYTSFLSLRMLLIVASGVLYISLSQLAIRRHRKNIRNQFSDIEKANLSWLQYLVIGMGGIWLAILFPWVASPYIVALSDVNQDLIIFSCVVAFVCFVGFFGLRQTHVFVNKSLPAPNTSPPATEQSPGASLRVPEVAANAGEKYARSGLKEPEATQLHKKLSEYVLTQKPYLNNTLSLTELAEKLQTQSNYLSQIINEKEQKNFYDYINAHRVEEFKRLSKDSKKRNYTVLALAFECGFNSKSAFNSFFKKYTGQTPSEYMKQNT